MTYEERQSRKQTKKLFHELFALRMELLYKLSIANHFRDQVIWLPSSLDFRGRAYPVPPHCSHIGRKKNESFYFSNVVDIDELKKQNCSHEIFINYATTRHDNGLKKGKHKSDPCKSIFQLMSQL